MELAGRSSPAGGWKTVGVAEGDEVAWPGDVGAVMQPLRGGEEDEKRQRRLMEAAWGVRRVQARRGVSGI